MARVSYIVTVQGKLQFPIDMLRYDRLSPLHESDSGLIHDMMTWEDRKHYPDGPKIQLVGESKPTDARWESFGWKVVDVEVRR